MDNRTSEEDRKVAADLLEAVLDGSISASDALQGWPLGARDELVE